MLETLPMWSDVQPQLQPHHQLHEDIETREPPGRESPEQWRFFQPGFRRPYVVPGPTPYMLSMLCVTPDRR